MRRFNGRRLGHNAGDEDTDNGSADNCLASNDGCAHDYGSTDDHRVELSTWYACCEGRDALRK